MSLWRYVSIQCHFLEMTLTQGHLHMKIKIYFLRHHWGNFNQILYVSFKVHGNDQDSINPLKTFFSPGEDVYKPYDLFSNPDTLLTMSFEMLCYKILKVNIV